MSQGNVKPLLVMCWVIAVFSCMPASNCCMAMDAPERTSATTEGGNSDGRLDSKEAKLLTPEQVIDCKYPPLVQGKYYTAELTIENDLKDALRGVEIKTSCGCTAAIPQEDCDEILPGQELRLSLRFRAERTPSFGSLVYIMTAGKTAPVATLRLQAAVVAPFSVEPSIIRLKPDETHRTIELRLSPIDRISVSDEIVISGHWVSDGSVVIAKRTDGTGENLPHKDLSLDLEIEGDLPSSLLLIRAIYTDDDGSHLFETSVQARRNPKLSVRPRKLTLEDQEGQTHLRLLLLGSFLPSKDYEISIASRCDGDESFVDFVTGHKLTTRSSRIAPLSIKVPSAALRGKEGEIRLCCKNEVCYVSFEYLEKLE